MKYKLLSNIAGKEYAYTAGDILSEEAYNKLPSTQKHHAKLIVEPVVHGAQPETEIKKEKK